MIRAASLPTPNASLDDNAIRSRLDGLLDGYESMGRDLDLFTSGEIDSPERFDFAGDLEMGLILFFSSVEADLPAGRPLTPLHCLDGAERLDAGGRWMEEMADRLESGFGDSRLASRLRLLSEHCQETASLLWWRWLTEFGAREPRLPSPDRTRPRAARLPEAIAG